MRLVQNQVLSMSFSGLLSKLRISGFNDIELRISDRKRQLSNQYCLTHLILKLLNVKLGFHDFCPFLVNG